MCVGERVGGLGVWENVHGCVCGIVSGACGYMHYCMLNEHVGIRACVWVAVHTGVSVSRCV